MGRRIVADAARRARDSSTLSSARLRSPSAIQPALTMHSPFSIQPARPADHADFVRFVGELGHDDPVPGFERWAREMMPHTFFLVQGERKVGYAYVEVFGALGYVRHVVVDRDARGSGVGRALMDAIARRLVQRECTRWELNVKRDNVPAIRLYESVGMLAQYSTSVVRIDWADALRLPADDDVTARDVEPSQAAAIERALHLPEGQVTRLREQQAHVLVQLVDRGGSVRGFARFDPGFPGAFPFRVTSPGHAGVVLRALHAVLPRAKPWLQLVIEDDPATARLLLESGARLVFEIVHYAGPLPRGTSA